MDRIAAGQPFAIGALRGAARWLVGGEDPEAAADSELRRALVARRDRFSRMRATVTGFVVVTTAEKMPVAESADIVLQLQHLGIDVACMVVNRRSPDDAGAFLAERRRHEDACLQVLRGHLDEVPLAELPLLVRDMTGVASPEELSGLLTRL